MARRLVELIIRKDFVKDANTIFAHFSVTPNYVYMAEHDNAVFKFTTNGLQMDEFMEKLNALPSDAHASVLVTPLEATYPEMESEPTDQIVDENKLKLGKFIRISKAELRVDIEEPVDLNSNFIIMILLSTIVAGIGIIQDNIAIVIGAMVIAPFLGPNMALAFGTTLGDVKLIRKAIFTGVIATFIVISISVSWGLLDPGVAALGEFHMIEYRDIILALVCGFAGAISIVSGQASSLVGVMVAAALLPPLMRAGLMFGAGSYSSAANDMAIYTVNIVSLNLSGIITFYLAGIRPGTWWEQKLAKAKTRQAMITWVVLLLIIVFVLFILREYDYLA